MKKFIYNNIFGKLTYEQKQEKIDERVTQIYDANKENEDIISKDAFTKKFEDGLTFDEKLYLKDKDLKDYYDQQIKDKREEFMSNLLKKALEKKAEVQKGKILGVKNKIEEVLKKYSPSNLKKFLQNLTEKEKIMIN